MLISRLYQPKESDILYHYCSSLSFQTILESGRIRFTDINMLNDNAEMHWGYSIFEEAAGKLIKIAETRDNLKGLNKNFFDKVDQIIAPLQGQFHPFVACFSREPDHLGQWRAYADDARGYSIGFRGGAIANLPASLLAVEYEREKQVEQMMNALGATYKENEADGHSFGDKFFTSCVMIGSYLLAFKNPIFRDEKEVRSFHVINVENTGKLMRLKDNGGQLGTKEKVAGEKVEFRIRDNALIGYLDISFRRNFESSAIKTIIIGAKNRNWPANIFYFSGSLGYEDITVQKSTSTYR